MTSNTVAMTIHRIIAGPYPIDDEWDSPGVCIDALVEVDGELAHENLSFEDIAQVWEIQKHLAAKFEPCIVDMEWCG